jgi:lipoprotein-anchoring transpeptidase ErfK/SrfK
MNVDYYSLLTKAVSGKDATARKKVYKDAHQVVAKSNLTRQVASSHVAALDDAIRRIEDELAAAEERDEGTPGEAVNSLLSRDTNWRRLAFGASAFITFVGLTLLLYIYVTTPDLHALGGAKTASSQQVQRGHEDSIMPDLEPGVDGGSSGAELPFSLQRQVVFYRTTAAPGSIVVDRENRFLYLVDSNNSARRYGIGLSQECLKGGSLFRITSKLEWPDWRPSSAEAEKKALLGAAGRPGSPLGARALLLDKPGLIIHGTNSPKTVGHLVASGCIRLVNDDVEDLYRRVSLDSRVVFVS